MKERTKEISDAQVTELLLSDAPVQAFMSDTLYAVGDQLSFYGKAWVVVLPNSGRFCGLMTRAECRS